MFCNIWSLLEHCHESSAGKNSFSLFSHFFTAHEDFFPSCSIPILDLEPIVGGYWLAVVEQCQGAPSSVRAAHGQCCLLQQTSQCACGICQLCIQPARTGCLGCVCWGIVTGSETLQRMSHSKILRRLEDVC